MSGKGRGRGRGRGAVNFDALKKPGAADSKPAVKEEIRPGHQQHHDVQHQAKAAVYAAPRVSVPGHEVLRCGAPTSPLVPVANAQISAKDRLLLAITRLTLDASSENVEPVVNLCKNYASTDATFEDVVRAVYGRCQLDWQFSRTAAMLCQQLCCLPELGPSFRNFFLRHVQCDFKDKDNLRSKSIAHFLGCMSFLCQLFNHLCSAEGQRFQPLIPPAFEALESLLDNRADTPNIECAAEQLLSVGRILQASDPDRMRRIVQTVRDFIVDSRGSRESRLSLIKVLESNASDWKLHSHEV